MVTQENERGSLSPPTATFYMLTATPSYPRPCQQPHIWVMGRLELGVWVQVPALPFTGYVVTPPVRCGQ